MAVEFNGLTKRITVTIQQDIDVRRDIYSEWKRWVILDMNTKYSQAIRSVGGDSIGGGNSSPNYFFLMNDWKIIVNGIIASFKYNLYCEEATNSNYFPFLYENNGHSNNEISSAPVVTIGGSSMTQEEHDILFDTNAQSKLAVALSA